MSDLPIWVIGGPTSSGKSSLGIQLAKECNGEIVSLDAVQVYQGLIIGSGAVTVSEQQGVPHHLIGIYKPNEEIDVSKVRALCKEKISEIQKRGKQVIITAGSTMYLSLVVHGLAELPPASKEIREKYKSYSANDLWEELRRIDPEASETFSVGDRSRVERALEVKLLTGKSIRAIQSKHRFPEPLESYQMISLWWNRQKLYERITQRCKLMIESGLLEEVSSLVDQYTDSAPALRSIGYKEMLQVRNKECTIEQGLERMTQATRNYAKRQMTFWKNEPLKRGWDIAPQSNDPSARSLGAEVNIQRGPKPKGMSVWEWSFDRLRKELLQIGPFKGVSVWNLSAESLIDV